MLRYYWYSFRDLTRTIKRSFGNFPRECSLCSYHGTFLGHGYPFVCDSLCPKCGSLENHRLLALANRDYDFFRERDVIHFAPDNAVRELVLAHRPRSYLAADLSAPCADVKENIEALTIMDSAFDVVICMNVLDHVNDRKAIGELFRVLKPGGVLLATFPIVEGWDDTFEDATGAAPETRQLLFGERHRARYFGRDARDRLAAPGFIVEEYTAIEPGVSRYGLSRGEKVFICSRPTLQRSVAMESAVMARLASGLDGLRQLQSASS
jgi:SAM-dependent methyltransferase